MNILGISAFYHDSAASLVKDGEIIAAAQEERFSRIKHDAAFPRNAVAYCLQAAGLESGAQLDLVAFYEKPFLKLDRLVSSYLALAPRGLRSFLKAVPVWLKQKLWIKQIIRDELGFQGRILFSEHHEAHAASAFFPSPFAESAVLTIDGVGEWTTTSIGRGEGNGVELLAELSFPHSLGLLYSAFTYYLGFRVNSGEYKVMGLAPYGEPHYRELILSELIDLQPDGSFRLNMRYFDYIAGLTMTNAKFSQLLGGAPRQLDTSLTQRHMDIARSIQEVLEEAMLRMARHAHSLTNAEHLCLAGGVALNCVGNGRILREGPFKKIWIQPAAGDAGGALGAALLAWHHYENKPRHLRPDGDDSQRASLLGRAYDARGFLELRNIPREDLLEADLMARVANLLANGKIIGWYQGRMEFGPRSLGNRSILADPRIPGMQETLNLKIKFRESFRPFAPAVLQERMADYFELKEPSPYMLLVAAVTHTVRSMIPAVIHIDGSARVQTVAARDNPRFHRLLTEFERRTGCAVLVNTSFNVRGEPPVCTPEDAFRCFMRTGMDYLVLGNFLLSKAHQVPLSERPLLLGGVAPFYSEGRASARPKLHATRGERPGTCGSTSLRGNERLTLNRYPMSWINEAYTRLDRSERALRRFGFQIGGVLLLLGAGVTWRHGIVGGSIGILGAIVISLAAFSPRRLGLFHQAWMTLSLVLGEIVRPICLTILFYLVLTPVGLLQRLVGKREMDLAFKTDVNSHWKTRTARRPTADYEKQF